MVDDRPANLTALEAILEPLGHRLVRATSGEEALKRLLIDEFAVILLDVMMPGLDGLETAAIIKGRERTRDIPIIFLSAMNRTPGEVLRGYSHGAVDYLVKPFDPELLRAKVAVFVDLFVRGQEIKRQAALLVRHQTITERERELAERARLVALSNDVGSALIQGGGLRETLQLSAQAVVTHLDAAFARIWTLDTEDQILELQASAGMYTHLDGAHSRVPVGKFKIGLIAEEKEPHLTNEVLGDPRVGDQEWAARERLVSFAGFPLIVEGRVNGVIAMFARHALASSTLEALGAVAKGIAVGIGRLRAERQRAQYVAELETARDEQERLHRAAQRAVQSRDDLLATVSHDLRSPLSAIAMAATLLLRSGATLSPEKIVKHASTIDRATKRMEHLIRDLLDIASIESGHLSLDPKPVAATTLVKEALEILEPAAMQKTLRLERRLPPEDLPVCCDKERLLQVLVNIVGNAIKFTPEKGAITVEAERHADHVRFAVADTGPGIAPDQLPHVFDRFWQAKDTAKAGTGLGLAICKGIVEQHTGRIWVESRLGEGTTFFFSLPSVSGPGSASDRL